MRTGISFSFFAGVRIANVVLACEEAKVVYVAIDFFHQKWDFEKAARA